MIVIFTITIVIVIITVIIVIILIIIWRLPPLSQQLLLIAGCFFSLCQAFILVQDK